MDMSMYRVMQLDTLSVSQTLKNARGPSATLKHTIARIELSFYNATIASTLPPRFNKSRLPAELEHAGMTLAIKVASHCPSR
eukprot:1123767-Pleurochrysis_carterae.AAC.1